MMRTIALRFSNNFAPKEGTIRAHQELIQKNGFVWYGKLGSRISARVKDVILLNEDPMILLIHSGSFDRYWAHIVSIQNETPPADDIPAYYRDRAEDFATWFKVQRFEEAPRNILSQCFVASSGASLSSVSRYSMNPYFIVDYIEPKADRRSTMNEST